MEPHGGHCRADGLHRHSRGVLRLDLFESVTGRTTSTLQLAAMFPWQTIPLLCVFALLCWSSNMRVQLVGTVLVFGLVNGTIMNRSIAVKVAAPLAP